MIEYYIWKALCSSVAIGALFLLLLAIAAIFNQKKAASIFAVVFITALVVSFLFGDIFVIITCGKAALGG